MSAWVAALVAMAAGAPGAEQAAGRAQPVPVDTSAEAERLGRQLAELGTLATLLPMVEASETEEMVRAQP